jgi:hypothetical protein
MLAQGWHIWYSVGVRSYAKQKGQAKEGKSNEHLKEDYGNEGTIG